MFQEIPSKEHVCISYKNLALMRTVKKPTSTHKPKRVLIQAFYCRQKILKAAVIRHQFEGEDHREGVGSG